MFVEATTIPRAASKLKYPKRNQSQLSGQGNLALPNSY